MLWSLEVAVIDSHRVVQLLGLGRVIVIQDMRLNNEDNESTIEHREPDEEVYSMVMLEFLHQEGIEFSCGEQEEDIIRGVKKRDTDTRMKSTLHQRMHCRVCRGVQKY